MYRVMIAESETATRKKLERALAEKDFKVESVADGRSALEKVKAVEPDLILLDVRMPELDGMQVLKKLREYGDTSQVVMVVDKGAVATAIPKALELGADDYIAKPVDPKELLVRVRRALSKSRRRQPVEVPLQELHDPESGRIDAKKVAEFLGVSLQRLADTLEANYQTVYKTPGGPSLQKGLHPIKRSVELVSRATRNQSEARAWLNNPHPHLGGRAPIDIILSGRAGAVVTMLENALSGIPG